MVLSDIDINQCDNHDNYEQNGDDNLMEFMGTHLCKPSTKVGTRKQLFKYNLNLMYKNGN